MPSTTYLIVGIITGALGLAYFVYGKRQSKIMFIVSGIGLMVYSYATSSIILLVVVGLLLLALPFLINV